VSPLIQEDFSTARDDTTQTSDRGVWGGALSSFRILMIEILTHQSFAGSVSISLAGYELQPSPQFFKRRYPLLGCILY
jgi:hypothetical protein